MHRLARWLFTQHIEFFHHTPVDLKTDTSPPGSIRQHWLSPLLPAKLAFSKKHTYTSDDHWVCRNQARGGVKNDASLANFILQSSLEYSYYPLCSLKQLQHSHIHSEGIRWITRWAQG